MKEVTLLMDGVPVMNTPRPFEEDSEEYKRLCGLMMVKFMNLNLSNWDPVNCTEHGWGCNCWLCRQSRNPNAEFI